ncbi:MAG: J domain-containing protein [Burkholderiales bacterium]|nr:J domain-containing protein [Burkholderiales bacterium]
MKFKDYYATLGVPRGADAEAIKKAYRKLARQHHPDVAKEAGADARFKEIGEAYATLKDPQKRAAYDQLGPRMPGEEFTPPPDWGDAHAWEGRHFDEQDLADLLAAMGRGRRPAGRSTAPLHGRDFEAAVRLTIEDAHRGTTINLDVAHEDRARTLAVTVPPGVTDGQRLRLRGRGGKGRNGGTDGDIYLHIQLKPHPVYRVTGHDLAFDLPLSPWEAALGADVEVGTLDGPVLLTVPRGTRSGRRLRLRGRGLAKAQGGRGDLYAVAHIDVPATLTARERELFEELSRVSQFRPRRVIDKEKPHEHAKP